MNSLGLQPNVDLGPTHTSVAALILDLVRRLSRMPGHQLVHAQPHLSHVIRLLVERRCTKPWHSSVSRASCSGIHNAARKSIISQFNRPADIPSTVIEDQLAAAILQLRSTYRRFDEALRIETLTQALLDRPQDVDQVYAAFPTPEFHLEVMRRTGWSPRLVQDGSSSASSTDHAGGVPVYPVSNETLRSVLFVMAMLAQPSPSPTQAVPDIIPSAAAVAVESSTSHASSVLLTSGAFSSLSAISPYHSSASLQNATSDVTGFLTIPISSAMLACARQHMVILGVSCTRNRPCMYRINRQPQHWTGSGTQARLDSFHRLGLG
ncbi:hypothetical protein BCR44DRAFT_1283227 [Catenaria anguillulae PL171]|uniref:Uncharacterized protein n=1 Tax=Catenaria anguillulae PL171 TaxID=765915 RepID=A0A1Y2HW95_9FUNG|nr:hypothetical protein BCR44DRAFT_1283227 [Catenaria anguillulae PL171]